jgi:hypothetical protein
MEQNDTQPPQSSELAVRLEDPKMPLLLLSVGDKNES